MSNEPPTSQSGRESDEKQPVPVPQNDAAALLPPPPPASTLLFTAVQSFEDRVNQLFDIFHQQSASISRLTAENQAHTSEIASLEGKLESLKQKNETLEKTVGEQGRLIVEVSKAGIPEGHWIEEDVVQGGGVKMKTRWVWSTEKYQPSLLIRTEPAPNLDSLPAELSDAILRLVEPRDRRALCSVSFEMLERTVPFIYHPGIYLTPSRAVAFVEARSSITTPQVKRIRPLLMPKAIKLHNVRPYEPTFERLTSLPAARVCISEIIIIGSGLGLVRWGPVLRVLNPTPLVLLNPSLDIFPPTLFEITNGQDVAFAQGWTALTNFSSAGPDTVIELVGTARCFALTAHMRRISPKGAVAYELRRVHDDGRIEHLPWATELKDVLPREGETLQVIEFAASMAKRAGP